MESLGFDPGTSVDAQALTNALTTNVPWVPLGTFVDVYYLKSVIRLESGGEARTVRSGIMDFETI
jgi:hypothetical protein